MRSRVFSLGCVVVLGLAVGDGSLAMRPETGAQLRPVWTETAWPFLLDAWGPGRAFRCEASVCGTAVTLKSGILDPQGKAIEGALKSLGVDGVASVRQGKVFDIEIKGSDRKKAEAALKQAADKLLANTVIENYNVEVLR